MANFTGTNADETITPSFVSPSVTASGGAVPSGADDVIFGGGGNDVIDAGGGNDTVDGGQGSDTVQLGKGNDTFIWNPGDGSDVVDGGSGKDTLQFNGSNVAEHIQLTANGGPVSLDRDIAAVHMDLHSIENINLAVGGGADTVVVNDLKGTGVKMSRSILRPSAPRAAMAPPTP